MTTKVIGISLVTCLFAVALPGMTMADSVRVEVRDGHRVCYDSDGDRVPCGRRYYRHSEGDRYYWHEGKRYHRHYNRPGFSLEAGPVGVYID